MNTLLLLSGVLLAGLIVLVVLIRMRNIQYWILSYIKQQLARMGEKKTLIKHVYFCFADHYEPYFQQVTPEKARQRVDKWLDLYPGLASKHTDSDGRYPQHSFFYPEEEYDESLLTDIAELCKKGFGDIEVHLHHDDDTAAGLTEKLVGFKHTLYEKHDSLRKNDNGDIIYAFIHGNWALDNSRPDGRWCGVENELDVLVDTGCYMDMTMPSAPSDTQTKKINSIYFAKGKDGCCKSHDSGRDVEVGGAWAAPGELLMVQGPLALNWKQRKLGLIPKIESGELSLDSPPSLLRTKLWAQSRVSVTGAEEHVFIKVHTHGATEDNAKMLFDNGGFDVLWQSLEDTYKGVNGCELHYVSAREMYEKVYGLVSENDSYFGKA